MDNIVGYAAEAGIAATGHDKSAYLGDLPRVLQLSWAESARWADTAEIAALTPCYTLNA